MRIYVWIGALLALGLAGTACRSTDHAALCDGVSCSGHGKCVVVRREPVCACEEGYRPDGPNCVPLPLAEPAPAPPGKVVAVAPPPPATEPVPGLDPDGTPSENAATATPELTQLCALALEALARPAEGEQPDLATLAKRDAIRRAAPAITEDCARFLLELAAAPETVECATQALRRAAEAGVDLGRLGAEDPAVTTCGERWKQAVEAGTEEFRRFTQRQRQAFGVAVFGFHRQYGFAGGPDEELCRRWLAAAPGAPPELLRATATPAGDWSLRLEACRRELAAVELRPLARWCLVDRADELRAARSADPCLPFAVPAETDALGRLVQLLLAAEAGIGEDAVPAPGPAAARQNQNGSMFST
ncbi:MAG: hypothetical protein JXB32_21680 [Deltaproteobacteria bacterium]|nr:hypothetical protein [Deltaproteobacteria bacterium]